jgi:hypothetical protein
MIERKYVLTKQYNKKNLLIINSVIEIKEETIRERIFFEFYKNYKRDATNTIKMVLSITDLRALIYAIGEVSKTGITQWKKITESNNIKKFMILTKEYLNANSNNLQISIKIENIYEMLAIRDDLKSIAAETELYLFKTQREKKLIGNKR